MARRRKARQQLRASTAAVRKVLRSTSPRGPMAAALLLGLAPLRPHRRNPVDQPTYRFLLRLVSSRGNLRDPDVAHDVATDTMMRFPDADRKLLTHLALQAARWAHGRRTRSRRAGELADESASSAKTPDEILAVREVADQLARAEEQLPAAQREAYRDWIARKFGGSAAPDRPMTASEKQRAHRAREHIRQALDRLQRRDNPTLIVAANPSDPDRTARHRKAYDAWLVGRCTSCSAKLRQGEGRADPDRPAHTICDQCARELRTIRPARKKMNLEQRSAWASLMQRAKDNANTAPRYADNPSSAERAARAAFREFHGDDLNPKVRSVQLPRRKGRQHLVRLGELREVVYQPRKGQRKGPAFLHRFGRGAVLAATVDGRQLVLLPAKRRPFRVDWSRGIVG